LGSFQPPSAVCLASVLLFQFTYSLLEKFSYRVNRLISCVQHFYLIILRHDYFDVPGYLMHMHSFPITPTVEVGGLGVWLCDICGEWLCDVCGGSLCDVCGGWLHDVYKGLQRCFRQQQTFKSLLGCLFALYSNFF